MRLGKRLGSVEGIDAHIAKKIAHAKELNEKFPETYLSSWVYGIEKSWENQRPQLIEHLNDKE